MTLLLTALPAFGDSGTQGAPTYAQRMGWNAADRVLILHVDDAGMSAESNQGTIRAIEDGAANSFSVMMPTPWVPEIVRYIKASNADAGLHLTLNAEWQHYRWGPLAGQPTVPGLVDAEGAMWRSVQEVVAHASAEEVATEIRAQLERARRMGFEPTHLDSHMGTLFARPDYLAAYVKLGVETGIPIMFPGGHNTLARALYGEQAGDEALRTGEMLWQQGLPVLDDLHNTSYGWPREEKVDRYVEAVRALQPGVTMMIMHCAAPSDGFAHITDSAPSRYGDLEAMLSTELAAAIAEEDIILTTWRELGKRAAARHGNHVGPALAPQR